MTSVTSSGSFLCTRARTRGRAPHAVRSSGHVTRRHDVTTDRWRSADMLRAGLRDPSAVEGRAEGGLASQHLWGLQRPRSCAGCPTMARRIATPLPPGARRPPPGPPAAHGSGALTPSALDARRRPAGRPARRPGGSARRRGRGGLVRLPGDRPDAGRDLAPPGARPAPAPDHGGAGGPARDLPEDPPPAEGAGPPPAGPRARAAVSLAGRPGGPVTGPAAGYGLPRAVFWSVSTRP